MARVERAFGQFDVPYVRRLALPQEVSSNDLRSFHPNLLQRAQRTWCERFQTEYRSAQLMTHFLRDLLDAGEALDITLGALEFVNDELRHAALCYELARALGATPELPNPVALIQSPNFLDLRPAERAVSTALAMLAVNETLSVGFLRDLQTRCHFPGVRAVLDATLGDETDHESFGWEYLRIKLGVAEGLLLRTSRLVIQQALEPQRLAAARVLARMSSNSMSLSDWPDDELVPLGLFSPERQALVFEATWQTQLRPKLEALSLL